MLTEPPLEPSVTEMPRLPEGSLAAMHRSDVSDSHSVASQPVCPNRPMPVKAKRLNPEPNTVTDVDPVPAALIRAMMLRPGASIDHA